MLQGSPTTRVWTHQGGSANGALKAVSVNLNALTGQTVWFGFKFYTDSTTNRDGFYMDDVRLTAEAYASCSPGTPPEGPAVAYRVTGLPASVQTGATNTFTVTAVDAAGTTATGYSGAATITSSDAQAVLPSDVTFSSGVGTARSSSSARARRHSQRRTRRMRR